MESEDEDFEASESDEDITWYPDTDDGEDIDDVKVIGNSEDCDPLVLSTGTCPSAAIRPLSPVRWSEATPASTLPIPFQSQRELRSLPKRNAPIDYFNLLFDDNFYDNVVQESNKQAEYYFRAGISLGSRVKSWKPLCKGSLQVFLGLLFHMGNIRVNELNCYWNHDPLYNIPCFREHMSRDMFLNIYKCLHFTESPKAGDPRPADTLYKIRPIITYFNNKMAEIYKPGKQLCINESMVFSQKKLRFRQCTLNEKNDFGIKLYMLAEPHGLVQKFQVCVDPRDQGVAGENQGSKVVKSLLAGFENLGHSIYMDNVLISVSLARELLQNKTYCTGSLRRNQEDNPETVVKTKLQRYESIQRWTQEGICVFKWKDIRDVLMISSEHSGWMVDHTNRKGMDKAKPEALLKYNNYMRGSEHVDQYTSYSCTRRSLKWYKKLFVHITQILLLNAYFLYKRYNIDEKKKLNYHRFTEEVIRALILTDYPQKRSQRRTVIGEHFPELTDVIEDGSRSGKRKQLRCRICSRTGLYKRVNYYCPACPGKPGLCVVPCFGQYHQNM